MSGWHRRPSGGRGAPDGAPDGGPGAKARLTAWVSGRVQGVGFRWWVRVNALELGLVGAVENLADGRVRIVAEGDEGSCALLLDRIGGPRAPGRVAQVTHRWDAPTGGLAGFVER